MNVFACLVHEAPDCVADMVANLTCLDPASTIVLYDGSDDRMGDAIGDLTGPRVIAHPRPRPMEWGNLNGFALDSMKLILELPGATTMTVVDSDQLLLRSGYSAFLLDFLRRHPSVGCVGTTNVPQPATVDTGPCVWAWKEVELWRNFLRRFPSGEARFPYWSFWPATVFTKPAIQAILELWDDAELQGILRRSQMWATEEILFPTLVALSGMTVATSPCDSNLVQYRSPFRIEQLQAAWESPSAFWVHPVPRVYDDELRAWVRDRHRNYRSVVEA